MITRLAVKFYLRHAKRCVRGSKIIAISLVALIATQILILVLTTQLGLITSLINTENVVLSLHSSDPEFSTDELSIIQRIVESNPQINSFRQEFHKSIIVETNNSRTALDTKFLDLTELNPGLEISNVSAILTSNLINLFPLNSMIHIPELGRNFSVISSISTSDVYISTGLYLDFKARNSQSVNTIHITTSNTKVANNFLKEIEGIVDITHELGDDEVKFIQNSRDNIIEILDVLTVMIAILVFLGLSNLVSTIIYESYYDIRILKSIGYTVLKIRSIYLLLVIILGFLGTLISIVFGILIPNILLISIALLLDGIYTPIEVNGSVFLYAIILGLIVPVIAAYRPLRRNLH